MCDLSLKLGARINNNNPDSSKDEKAILSYWGNRLPSQISFPLLLPLTSLMFTPSPLRSILSQGPTQPAQRCILGKLHTLTTAIRVSIQQAATAMPPTELSPFILSLLFLAPIITLIHDNIALENCMGPEI